MDSVENNLRSPDSPPPVVRRGPRIGFLIHGKTVWFSELLATIIVSLLLICLMSITIVLFFKGRETHQAEQQVAVLKSEKIAITDTIDILQRELRILTLLRRVSIDKVSDTTLCKVAALVSINSAKFGYDPLLLLSVIHVESIFDPSAKGRFQSGDESGAIGLMQLKYETAVDVAQQLHLPRIRRRDLLKPDINLVLGVAYLTQLITQFRSFKLGLLAYNQGPVAVYQTLSSGAPLTQDYYRLVLRSYFALKRIEKKMRAEKK